MEVRERIRINGAPISQDLFAKYFFEVWDRLDSTGVSSFLLNFIFSTSPILIFIAILLIGQVQARLLQILDRIGVPRI